MYFYDESTDTTGNNYLKNNFVAIAEELNKYAHITLVDLDILLNTS